MIKFFVVGCPRSGTTLLQQMLNRHSGIAVPPETSFATLADLRLRGQVEHLQCINADLGIRLAMPHRRIRTDDEFRSLYCNMARQYVESLDHRVTHFGEKTPRHQRFLARLWKWFPDAKIILIHRDGRDVALSLTRGPWTPGELRVGFALWLHYAAAQFAVRSHRRAQLHVVRYEDLIYQPELELRRIVDFLGIGYESSMAEGDDRAEGINAGEEMWRAAAAGPVNQRCAGRWRAELPAAEIEFLERWGGATLTALGYPLVGAGGHWPALAVAWTYFRCLAWLARNPSHARARALCREGLRQPNRKVLVSR